MSTPIARRAIVLRRSDGAGRDVDQLVQQHNLTVVYTVTTDTSVPRMAVMIAVEHALNRRTEVVVIPHLTRDDVWAAREWLALAELWDVVIGDGTVIDAEFAQP